MAQQAAYDSHIVIADFVGSAENELTIKVGDAIIVLQSTPEGWSEGYTADGRQGWYPSAYAKYNPAGRDEVIEEIKERNDHEGEVHKAAGGGTGGLTSSTQNAAAAGRPRSTSGSNSSSSSGSLANAGKKIMVGGGSSKSTSTTQSPSVKTNVQPPAGPSPFPGIRLNEDSSGGAFPGIRLRPPPPVGEVASSAAAGGGAFPGIRLHSAVPVADKKEEKKKKAEEKKKEKERLKLEKKKEKELKKDLRMASSGLFGVPLKATIVQENHETQIPFIVRCCVAHILKGFY